MTRFSQILDRIIASPFAARLARVSGGGRAFLPILAALWAAAIMLYVFVGIADPYRLRFSRAPAVLADHLYPVGVAPRLASVVSAGGVDLLVLGASTAMGYTPTMLREAYRDVRKPFNFTYACASAHDFDLLAPIFLRSTTLKRVVLNLDITLVKPCETEDMTVRRYYSIGPFNLEPEFNLESVNLSLRSLATGVLDLPRWRPKRGDLMEYHTRPSILASKVGMDTIRRAAEFSRSWVTSGKRVECDALPTLRAQVLPFVRTLAGRGVAVDIVFPPYSLAFYSEETVIKANAIRQFPGQGALFANFMAVRRCTLEMIDGLDQVRAHEFSTDLALTGDLSHYVDVAHLRGYETYRTLLQRIARGEGVITAAEWPATEARIKQAVDQFKP